MHIHTHKKENMIFYSLWIWALYEMLCTKLCSEKLFNSQRIFARTSVIWYTAEPYYFQAPLTALLVHGLFATSSVLNYFKQNVPHNPFQISRLSKNPISNKDIVFWFWNHKESQTSSTEGQLWKSDMHKHTYSPCQTLQIPPLGQL